MLHACKAPLLGFAVLWNQVDKCSTDETDACVTQHPFVWRNILVCLLEEFLQTKRSIMKASTRVCIPHCRNVENHHNPDLLTCLSAFQAGLKS